MSIHSRTHLNRGDVVIVNCTHQCNVKVMDDANYRSYQSGGQHRFYGGEFRRLPARIPIPSLAIGASCWKHRLALGMA